VIYDFRLTIYDLTDKMQRDLFYWAKRLKEGKAKSRLAVSLLAFEPSSPENQET
jgi:hypothetical protein